MTRTADKTWVEVSRSALRHNARELRRAAAPGSRLIAVVKSNAYGHGTGIVVKAVDPLVDRFAVDSVDEARAVRAAGSGKPVLILGYTPLARIKEAVASGFSFTAYDMASVRAAGRAATARRPAKIHVKVETGTSRQGVLETDLGALLTAASRTRGVVIEGLSTHYANIEDTADPSYAMKQLGAFSRAVEAASALGIRPPLIHTACSAAVLLYPQTHFTAVRAGIALYGLWPSPLTKVSVEGRGGEPRELRPALAWKTIVAQVKRLPKGTPISYGLTERLSRDSAVAVLPIGYWDGFDRKHSSIGTVLIRGRRAKVLGRVCMNMCVADVTDIPGARPEDEVVLLGSQGDERVSAEDLAGRIGTINYEVVTRINPVLPRYSVA